MDVIDGKIDTEFKAYLLGWIASDKCCIETDRITTDAPITVFKDGKICSRQFCDDIRRLFNMSSNASKKHFPKLENDDLSWSFIRGLFDADGKVYDNCRKCEIISRSFEIEKISEFCGIRNVSTDTSITFYGTNSVDFLAKLYDTSDENLRVPEKYNLYLCQLLNFRPVCKFVKTRADAMSPSKLRCSDEGYDLWLIDVDKKISDNTIRYDTFLKVQPQPGWHVEILPRSSLSNSGYILSNCVGLIDSSYNGTLKITLTKINEAANEIELPFKAVQMVLRRNVHFICEEVDEFDENDATKRGEGGFGSTDL